MSSKTVLSSSKDDCLSPTSLSRMPSPSSSSSSLSGRPSLSSSKSSTWSLRLMKDYHRIPMDHIAANSSCSTVPMIQNHGGKLENKYCIQCMGIRIWKVLIFWLDSDPTVDLQFLEVNTYEHADTAKDNLLLWIWNPQKKFSQIRKLTTQGYNFN